MNNSITKFSNNIFDLNILTKKEFNEIVEYFISTINILKPNDEKDHSITPKTLLKLKEFGLIIDDNLDILKKNIDKNLFEQLIYSINLVEQSDLDEYPELSKFNLKRRNYLVKKENSSNKPTVVDLFCGSGGLSLGLVQAGFRIIFSNDIEKSALRTYNFNHPELDGNKITMGGIEDIASDIASFINEPTDLLVGGPPCQGFSMANRQRIIDDPRNILYKYYVESVHQLKPKFIIMENVKGMASVANQVKNDFNSNMETTYDIDYKLFNAKHMGVPQNRERLIFIGIRDDVSKKINLSASDIITTITDEYSNDFIPIIDAISDLREVKASRKKNFTKGDDISGYIIEKNIASYISDYVNTINNQEIPNLIFNHKARYNNDRDIEIYSRMLPGDKSDSPRIADIMPYKNRSHIFKDKYFKLIPSLPSKTITAHMKFDCNMYIHPLQARGLTPREAARIQSYPDNYFFLGAYTKTYQQIGNSVPPLMAKKIGEQFITILNNIK